jgi:hypothetical protein
LAELIEVREKTIVELKLIVDKDYAESLNECLQVLPPLRHTNGSLTAPSFLPPILPPSFPSQKRQDAAAFFAEIRQRCGEQEKRIFDSIGEQKTLLDNILQLNDVFTKSKARCASPCCIPVEDDVI